MSYPNGCTRGNLSLICPGCDSKQQQACKDSYDIIQRKLKTHKGKTNAQIAAEDNERILKKKYSGG